MKRLLVALALVGTFAVQAANERLETIQTALADLVELAGPEVLANTEENGGMFISCSKAGPFAEGDPSNQLEDPEVAADARKASAEATDGSLPSAPVRAKVELMASSSAARLTVNRLNGSISFDESLIGSVGNPSHYVCYGSSGTLMSALSTNKAVSISFELSRGSGWLSLSSPWIDGDGYKCVTYTAASNVGGNSRYGLIKCRETYWSGEQLVELCTWYPIGQCGDYLYDKKSKSVFAPNYSVLCYDWAADSGNGTGMKAVPIRNYGVPESQFKKWVFTHTSENSKLVTVKTNKSKLQTEYTYYANMGTDVKSCLTTTKIKGFSGQKRTWNFFAPKPPELLDVPMDFVASDNQVTNVVCTWSAVEGATSYKVFRNGILLGTTEGTRFDDGTGTPGKSYTYSVVAETTLLGYALATSPAAKDTGKSIALVLKSIRMSSYPKSVYAGCTYPKALVCTATFNDGLSKVVKASWSVTKGKATVNSSGTLRVNPKASGTLGIKAKYTYAKKTCSASASIKVVKPPKPDPERTIKKFFIGGPSSIASGNTENYMAFIVWSDNVTNYVSDAEWTQLTGKDHAAMAVEQPYMKLTALYTGVTCGTMVKAEWNGYSDVKRVEIVSPDPGEPLSPEVCVDGDPTGVIHTAFKLPIRIDCAFPVTVTASGLPKTLGLAYDSKKGVISGVPKKTGTYKVTVTAKGKYLGTVKSSKLTFSLKILALPSWAKGSFSGIAQYDLLTDYTTQFCPFANATASLKSSGASSVKFSFASDTETFSATKYASATISGGKVTALQLSGTLKTATGKLSARGEVTAAHLRLWTIAGSRQAYAEMYRKISTSVKSEKKLISKVAGWSYTASKLKLKIDKNGKMTISGKTPKNRKVSASCYPHLCDGAIYYRFVFTPTGAGGNGYYIYLKSEGSSLRYWELSF